MTVWPADIPLSGLPFDARRLEQDVVEMERTLDLLRRRDQAAAALEARGIELSLDTLKPADIFSLVAARRGCSVAEIRGSERCRTISHARHEVFYLMAIQVKRDGARRWSTTDIGQRVAADNRPAFDHTTVLHGISRHAERLRASAAGERPAYVKARSRPPITRVKAPIVAATVCMLPTGETCPGCGAPGGEPCFDGARRG